jgi:hypothetical protein
MHALESQLSVRHRVYQHRKHDIRYSFVDNGNGTFSPVALIYGADRVPCPVNVAADVNFRHPLQAANRALVEAMMVVDESIGR